ncbi:MAG: hypothetical protein SFV81_21235 [Pirellulaceae bacterium]|nr:hypothetical protein [Pirellulaceae bacterium]
MSASTKASTPPPVKRTSILQSWTFPLAFVGIGIMVALLFGYLQATVVTGTEFDTGSWSTRTFWYRRDPFSGRQMTGILRDTTSSISTTAAFPNSYFSGPSNKPPRWDLVKLQSGAALTEGPAYVLNSYFDGYVADQLWTTWSTDNPNKAKILWTAARDLVDLELYHELPKIMDLARVDSTDEEFTAMIRSEVYATVSAHAEKLRVAENAEELTVAENVLSTYSTNN